MYSAKYSSKNIIVFPLQMVGISLLVFKKSMTDTAKIMFIKQTKNYA